MNRAGRAARFAYDPIVVVMFLDHHTAVRTDGVPRRRRRYINGCLVDRDTDARVIRRWRHVAEGLTLQGVDRLLTKFYLSINDLHHWADAHGLQPVLRGVAPVQTTKES